MCFPKVVISSLFLLFLSGRYATGSDKFQMLSQCPQDPTCYTDPMNESICYVFTERGENATFGNAEWGCVSRGGNLTSIADGFHNMLLQTYADCAGVSNFYLGALNVTGEWVWVDKAFFGYQNFQGGNENEQCAIMTTEGMWFRVNCYVQRSYVCTIPKPVADTTTKSETSSTSTTTPQQRVKTTPQPTTETSTVPAQKTFSCFFINDLQYQGTACDQFSQEQQFTGATGGYLFDNNYFTAAVTAYGYVYDDFNSDFESFTPSSRNDFYSLLINNECYTDLGVNYDGLNGLISELNNNAIAWNVAPELSCLVLFVGTTDEWPETPLDSPNFRKLVAVKLTENATVPQGNFDLVFTSKTMDNDEARDLAEQISELFQ